MIVGEGIQHLPK